MQTWGLTDPGNIRQQNQDSYAIVPFGRDRVLMIVCDGMGGAKSGNVASSLAVEVFTDEVRRTQRPGMTPEKAAAMLRSALELSNSAVYEQSQLSDDFTGMGTTLVAALVRGLRVEIVNIGDSRAYHLGADGIRCVTVDHSLVELMVQRGELTHEQAKNHPSKNLITRALGVGRDVEADFGEKEVSPRDILLLCSDGLSNCVSVPQIEETLARTPFYEAADALVQKALEGGGLDNITVLLMQVEAVEENNG